MTKNELNQLLSRIDGQLTYALGHLDKEQHGYADSDSLCDILGVIDDILSIPGIDYWCNIDELNYWRQFILEVKKGNDKDNMLTVAVGKALRYIHIQLVDLAKEVDYL